jgi:hypothetical protein
MATTALRILDKGQEKRLLFMTVASPTGVDVDLYMANEEFVPEGKSSLGTSEMDEERYHRELRQQASAKGQFVPEFSTNEEWNPQPEEEEPCSE